MAQAGFAGISLPLPPRLLAYASPVFHIGFGLSTLAPDPLGHGIVYSVLIGNQLDDVVHNEVAGSIIAEDGTLWKNAKKVTPEAFGTYIASACHYSIPVAKRLFEAALLNEPWTVNRALGEKE